MSKKHNLRPSRKQIESLKCILCLHPIKNDRVQFGEICESCQIKMHQSFDLESYILEETIVEQETEIIPVFNNESQSTEYNENEYEHEPPETEMLTNDYDAGPSESSQANQEFLSDDVVNMDDDVQIVENKPEVLVLSDSSFEDDTEIEEEDEIDEVTLHHGKQQCTVCRRWVWRIKEHSNMHTKRKVYGCSHHSCNKKAYSQWQIKQHMIRDHSKRDYKCDQCDSTFITAYHLKSHKVVHIDEKLHECPRCHKKYKRKGELRKHINSHAPLNRFECDGCGKQYSKHESLIRHFELTGAGSTLQCLKCDDVFDKKCKLELHVRSYHLVYTQYCLVCNDRLDDPFQFESHLKKFHANEIKLRCTDCENCIFDEWDQLDKHMKEHRTMSTISTEELESMPYKCLFCFKRFKTACERKEHAKSHILVKLGGFYREENEDKQECKNKPKVEDCKKEEMEEKDENVCKNLEVPIPTSTPVVATTSIQEPVNVIAGNNSNVMMAPQNMLPINYLVNTPTLMQPIIINAPIILQPCNDYYYFVVPSQQ